MHVLRWLKATGTTLIVAGTVGAAVAGFLAWQSAQKTYELQVAESAKTTVTFREPSTLDGGGECSTRVSQSGLQVAGTAHIEDQERLWLLIQAPGVGKFYLTSGVPVDVDTHGRWSQWVADIGSDADASSRFTLVAVAADLDATSTFQRTYAGPQERTDDGASVAALPVGAYVAAQACLIRT